MDESPYADDIGMEGYKPWLGHKVINKVVKGQQLMPIPRFNSNKFGDLTTPKDENAAINVNPADLERSLRQIFDDVYRNRNTSITGANLVKQLYTPLLDHLATEIAIAYRNGCEEQRIEDGKRFAAIHLAMLEKEWNVGGYDCDSCGWRPAWYEVQADVAEALGDQTISLPCYRNDGEGSDHRGIQMDNPFADIRRAYYATNDSEETKS